MTEQADQENTVSTPDPNLCTSLKWVLSLDEDFDDMPSFAHMRAKAQGELDTHERIGKDFTDPKLRKTEWDDTFQDENNARREAIRLIDERVRKLGRNPAELVARQSFSPLYRG